MPNLFVMNDTAFKQAFYCIAAGPDGNLWFTEFDGIKIGRITDEPVPAITLQPNSGPPGTVVQVTGSGYGSFERIRPGFLDSGHMTGLGTVTTDGTGDFDIQVMIPSRATLGSHRVVARGLISGLADTRSFTVT